MGKKSKSKTDTKVSDSRFVQDERFRSFTEPGPSRAKSRKEDDVVSSEHELQSGTIDEEVESGSFAGSSDVERTDGKGSSDEDHGDNSDGESHDEDDIPNGMDPSGFAGPSSSKDVQKIVKPLTPEALAAFKAKQERTGVIYISRIPPGMRPTKVRHIMSTYGEIGRVYLQPEDPKRTYLRKKYSTSKKPQFTEGWVEFMDKCIARSVANMLNAQPIGGKKGSRWRDDVWTMKYLPKFKWGMLTEQIAHEAAVHAARLRVELEQSRKEQREYLKHVELARVLDKRKERKRKAAEAKGEQPPPEDQLLPPPKKVKRDRDNADKPQRKDRKSQVDDSERTKKLDAVLGSIF